MSQFDGLDLSVVRPRVRPRVLTPEELDAEAGREMAASAAAMAAAPDFYDPDVRYNPPVDPTMQIQQDPPDPLADNERIMAGLYGAQEQAIIEAARREVAPLPVMDETSPPEQLEPWTEDAPLPPVQGAPDGFDGLDLSVVRPRQVAPDGFDGLDLSVVRPRAAAVEAQPVEVERKPLNLSFGGQEAALAKAMMNKPVTTPEAADGTDVTFEKDGPAFQFTGSLVMEPGTGPTTGLDGMVPAPARGPMATMPGAAEPVMNRSPRLVPSAGGQIVFDQSSPERFTQGVEEAFAAGILPQSNYEKIKASQAEIFKVVDDRRKLEEKAQTDPKLLAVLQGLGRGGAMTAGAMGGAKALGAAGALTGPAAPIAAPVLATVGAVAGGIGSMMLYDTAYKYLAEHFEEYDNVMKAAELYPMHKEGGQMLMAGLALPVSAVQAGRGFMTTAAAAREAGQAVAPAVARQAAAAGAAGGVTGVAAYPVYALAEGQPITPGGFATAAAMGVATGGFFINNRAATQKDLAAVAAKMKEGKPLTAAEAELARVAAPTMRAAFAEMDAAGGRRLRPGYDAEGNFRANDPEFTARTTSVAGFMPRVAGAQARVPYEVPLRLPAGAVRAAQARAEAPRPATATAGAGDGAATPRQPSVPREAPVNVLPTGPDVIPMPGPAVVVSRAMLTPDAFVDAVAAERGLDMDFNPTATEELFAEHFELVKAAVSNNEPVSAAAMDLYEMRVPYYVRNEETGVATYDEAAFRAYEDYLMGRDREFSQDMTEMGGVELLAAVIELGGLPSRQAARSRRSAWSGELEMLLQNAQGAGKGKGSDNQKGVFLNKLFRKDGKDLDDIVTGLRGKGFRVETPQQLIEMLDVRLRTGNEVFGVPTQSMEDVPLEMRGRRAPRPAAGQMDLLGEQDVEFSLVGQTDRSSLTPQELAEQARQEQLAAEAEAAQTELFGKELRGARPRRPTKDLLGREISAEQLAFNEEFLLSGVVDPSLTTAYATDFPNMAAAFAEQQQAIGGPSYGQTGRGVVRVYPRKGARETTVNEFTLPKDAQPVAEFTPAQVRAGEHLKWFAQQRTAGPAVPTGETTGGAGAEPWRLTKREFFHPQVSRRFIEAESARDGTIIGTIGDVVHGQKTRQLLEPVLDVPIMVMRFPVQGGKKVQVGGDYVFDGSSGRVAGAPTIFINPNERMVGTLWEEAAHQMRRAKGRPIRKTDIAKVSNDDAAFERDYKNDPEELSAKRLAEYLGSLASKEKSHEQIVSDAIKAGQPVPETVRAEYETSATGPDPLTPPASVRSGGPAKVPPGTPVGMAAINPPDWVTAPGETSAGRRLIKGIENFRPGQRWGFRSIVDFVNEAVRLEMRRSTSQTTRTHPAHYKPAHHMAYTRETQSQINFHEAGHGLEYLIRARVPDFFNAYADELLALANRPGSMASDAPTALSAEAQRQYRIGEGVAEWTRLLMVDPAAVQNLKVTAALSEVAERFYPGMAKSLRDGARAVNAFQAADVATRWAMFNAVPGANPSANELIGAIVRGGESAVNMIASGAPVSALDRKITRAIIKQRKETETAYGAAVKKARETRSTNLTPLMSAYNMILSIGAETQLAISGQSISKGLRIVEDDGSFRYLTHETWRDLRKKVPATKLAQFDQAAWAKESLNRYENGGLEYPGMREGISPKDLKAIVAAAEREIPNFTAFYKEQSRFHDLILEVKEAGGLISPVDRAMMQSARDGYWPLPRVMTAGRGRGGRGRGDISAGVFKARGSGEAIRNIDEVTEERTREMFEAYYWNRFGTKLYDNMLAVAKDKSLPAEARKLAGSTMVKLKMPMQSAAKVSKEEALGWVMKAIGDAYERALGFRPEVKAEDINLSWSFRDVWRPVKPTDVNVVSLLRDGKREYYQIGDPAMFALFSRPQEARAAGKFVSWAVGPMTENWKRNITQGLVFAVRNMFRDVFTQPMMNPDPVGWVPGWSHFKGAVNKWTQKYPQVFSEGLLLSRVEPSSSEMVNSVKHGAVWQWLTEGFYVSQAKDPIVRTLATVLNPSNFLFPLWKTVDLINLVTGGRTLAQFMETAGREGAAVAALERGATDEEALAKYWTAAGQFNEHAGNADARIMMRVPGFLNPMLQGLRNQVQKLTDPDPAVAGTTWLRLLAMMPVAFGGAAIARYLLMDEKEKAAERQRPVDERMNFMDLGGFSIPFPFGVEGVMGSVVYNATMDDLLSRPKVDADRTALMLLKRIADPGSALQFFGPQLATLTEANMNWSSFRQKHIVAPWMVNLPASEQYYSTTPEFYRKMGTMMNYSPAKLQYIVQQAISRQADETIRLAESLDRGRPIMEAADVPFVGRMFVRDPIGFGSQAVRSAAAVEDKLRLLDERLKSKGWASLKDPTFPADQVGSVELRKLQVQLAYLEDLRKGLRVLSDMQGVGKYYTLARDYANERNVRTLQTQYTQSLLIGNRDRLAVLEQALDLVKQIPQAPPEQVAAEYLDRRF